MSTVLRSPELQSLFESVVLFANDVVLVTEAEPVAAADGGPRVVYVNPAFTRMTGYRPEDIVGLTPRVLQSPKTDQAQLDEIRLALAAWQPVEVELLNVRKDGSEFWVQLSITPVSDGTGLFTHWVAIQRDITARKNREIALKAMLEQSSDLMLLLNPDGTVADVNVTVRPVLGFSPAQLIGTPFAELTHPDDNEAVAALLSDQESFRLGERALTLLRLKHQDGSWRWIELHATDLDAERSIIVLVCADVTSRIAAEAHARALAARFRSTFDDAPIGMALTDPAGRFVQVNSALCELLGRDREALMGQPLAMVVHPDDESASSSQRIALLDTRIERIRHETRFLHADGSIVGVLHSSSIVTGEDGDPSYLVDHIEDITERQQFEAQLRHRALHDPLTGLANRALLTDRLQLALRGARPAGTCTAVLFVDLDRFKTINDTLGHAAGDAALNLIAERFEAAASAGQSVARFSGDEFVVLLPAVTVEQAVGVAHTLRTLTETPMPIAGTELTVTASIGVTVTSIGPVRNRVDNAKLVEDLLRQADAAMYTAKERGRNRVEIYDRSLGDHVRANSQLQNELRIGIQRGELRLHYQPQINLLGGEVTGVEALVRWQHPQRGLLVPAQFITLAEDCGQIGNLGDWVLDEALRTAAAWRSTEPEAARMWVNLSPHQLRNPDFATHVQRKLAQYQLPGEALGLEITENVLMNDVPTVRDTLDTLRADRVKIAIDDFGTGYSSLSYLAQFPVDTIKIDRSFVAGLDQDTTRRESFAIVGAIIGLAHALRLTVVAEGIETLNQANAMHGLGCDNGQGFLYGHPTPEIAGVLWTLPSID